MIHLSKKPRIAIDWDGTLVEDVYPEQGDWLPGAVEALKVLDEHFEIVIFSCRVAGVEFGREELIRNPAEVAKEVVYIQTKLTEIDLGHLEVWRRPYKPSAAFYIDDKALRFNGNWPVIVWKAVGIQLEVDAPERHPNSQRFHDLLREAGELHDKKQADYGRGDDPFANVRASSEWGLDSWVGAMVRLTDKVRRLQSLATKGELANEAAIDSFMDIAVYAIIARILFEEGGRNA